MHHHFNILKVFDKWRRKKLFNAIAILSIATLKLYENKRVAQYIGEHCYALRNLFFFLKNNKWGDFPQFRSSLLVLSILLRRKWYNSRLFRGMTSWMLEKLQPSTFSSVFYSWWLLLLLFFLIAIKMFST